MFFHVCRAVVPVHVGQLPDRVAIDPMQRESFVQDPTYADHFGAYRAILARVLRHDPDIFDLPCNIQIVDVGCGYGDLLKTLRSRGYDRLVGVEPDAVCRNAATKEGLDVRDGTLAETGLPSQFADAAIVNEVFHHVDYYARAVSEIARIVKPNGYLCMIEPAPTVLRRTMDFLTFETPLRHFIRPVQMRYEVMHLEMETGLYPRFLTHQAEFAVSLTARFKPLWWRRGWFFQFGKFQLRDQGR
jgi:SAM-dependent methyltransferase